MARRKKDNRKIRDKTNSPIDKLPRLIEGAAAIGITAAALNRYKPSLMSDVLNKAYRAADTTISEISKRSGKGFDIRSAKKAIKTFTEEYQKNATEYNPLISKTSIGNVFKQGKNAKRIAQKLQRNDVISNVVDELADKYAGKSSEINARRKTAINSLFRKTGNLLNEPNVDSLYKFRTTATKKLEANDLFNTEEISDITNEAIDVLNRLNHLHKSEFDTFGSELGRHYNGKLRSMQDFEESLTNGSYFKRIEKITEELKSKLYDIDELEKQFGSKRNPTTHNKFAKEVLGNNPLTINEFIEQYQSGAIKQNDKMNTIVSEMSSVIQDDERFGDLYFDTVLRKFINKDGTESIQHYETVQHIGKKMKDLYDETIIAKVLKLDEIANTKNDNYIDISYSGSFNPIIEKLINSDSGSKTLTNTFLTIGNKAYKFTPDSYTSFEEIHELSGNIKTVNKNSVAAKSLTKMFGADNDTGNTRGGFLDFHESTAMNSLESLVSKLSKSKDPRYLKNEAKSVFIDGLDELLDTDTDSSLEDIYSKYSDINKFLKNQYKELDRTSASRLHDALNTVGSTNDNSTRTAKRLLNILSQDDNDMVSSLIDYAESISVDGNQESSRFLKSDDFAKELRLLVSNPASYLDTKHVSGDYIPGLSQESPDAHSVLRRKVTDEIMLNLYNSNDIKDTSAYLSSALGEHSKKAKDAVGSMYSSLYSYYFSSAKSDAFNNMDDLYMHSMQAVDMMLEDDSNAKGTLYDIINSNLSLLKEGFNDKSYYESEYSDKIFVPKTKSPLDIIRNLNDSEKRKESAEGFAKQFFASTNNPESMTDATFAPFFFVNRLLGGFEKYGLGFSSEAYSSTASLAGNLMLKRVLPVAGALYGLGYLDFESENFFGSGLKETFLSGVANVDLGVRRITDTVGLTSSLRNLSVSNPVFSYLSNEQEYQSYDERKEWYESGYSPVRSGRWWSFGSSSEFRGGKISYYTPSYLRRETSNYYDISVYGSSDEKWAHSWIPTPRHPFSTLKALSNPYWLEEKHYEDRPYPVSGPMFDSNTPWGVILNPTIGSLLKPQKRMHQDVLQGTSVDVRALIKKRNEEQMQKSANNNYIKLGSDGTVTAMQRPIGHANGELPPNYNVYYDNSDIAYYSPVSYADNSVSIGNEAAPAIYTNSSMSNMTGYYGSVQSDLSAYDKMRTSNNPIVFAASRVIPTKYISTINSAIKEKGRQQGYSIAGYNTHGFIYDTEKYTEGGKADPTTVNFDKNDFIESRSVEEWLHDVGYSAKELGGIYGFAIDLISPPKQKYAYANSSAMSSFSNRFWDENIGGYGGDLMEIARRFFPHEDHSVTKINNIQNTMPEWIPSKFQAGDPYTALPKGDMRLPGPGYESLNELHPDEFGRRNCRIKIVRIAGNSLELQILIIHSNIV